MARPPLDPSGAKQTLTIRLSPRHLAKLDELARAVGRNRTNTITRLIDLARIPDTKETP